MHVVQHRNPVRRSSRRMHSPIERGVVSGKGVGLRRNGYRRDVGLSGVDGLFNIGKMFSRLTTFTPSSFQLKNIMGALGSATIGTLSFGTAALAPKLLSAHSSISKAVGYGTAAVALAAGGAALLPAGSLTAIGSGLATGIKTVASVLPVAGQVLGGGGQQQQQGGMNQAEYDAYMRQQAYAQQQALLDEQNRQQQAAYEEYVRQQQAQMYLPQGSAQPVSMNTSYGDLRSPYTAITEDGEQVEVDPSTGQIIKSGMSTEMMIGIGALALVAGVYFFSGNEKTN